MAAPDVAAALQVHERDRADHPEGTLGLLLDSVTEPQEAAELVLRVAPQRDAPQRDAPQRDAAAATTQADDRSESSRRDRPSTVGHRPGGPERRADLDVHAVADAVYAVLVRRQEIERDRGGG